MADLIVTFCKTKRAGSGEQPVPRAVARTTALLITSTNQRTTDVALADEFVHLVANAACWVKVAPSNPTAAALTSSATTQGVNIWPMPAGSQLDLACSAGDQVAVIQA